MRVRPSCASRRNSRPDAAARSPGSSADTGSLRSYHLRVNTPVGPRVLELDGADESCRVSRFELPDEERGGERRGAGGVDQAQARTRRQLEADRRVQITVRQRRPSPHRVFDQLAIGPVMKHCAADVSARLSVEQANGGGVRRTGRRSRFGLLRLEQLWLEHAAGYHIGPSELARGRGQAENSEEKREAAADRAGHCFTVTGRGP